MSFQYWWFSLFFGILENDLSRQNIFASPSSSDYPFGTNQPVYGHSSQQGLVRKLKAHISKVIEDSQFGNTKRRHLSSD